MARRSEASYSRHIHVFWRQSVCDGCSSGFRESQSTHYEYDDAQFMDGNIAFICVFASFPFIVLLHVPVFLCECDFVHCAFSVFLDWF